MKRSIGAHPFIFPNPVLLVGSYDENGVPNLMTVAWGGICCSVPPSIAISPARRTLTCRNINARGAFTVCIPSESQVRQADYVGIYSGRNENKFEALGLTEVRSEAVAAPFAAEFPVVLECRVSQSIAIGEHTMQFIGEILDIKAEEGILGDDGLPDIRKVKPFAYDQVSKQYFTLGTFLAKAFSIGRKR